MLFKRLFSFLLVMLILVSLSGCSEHHTHVYDNACDADCNECGELREAKSHVPGECIFDDCNHVYVCTECGEQIGEPEIHDFDANGKCSVCGYEADIANFPSGVIAGPNTIIESEHIIFTIAEGIFYPGNIIEIADALTNALEKVSGLEFLGGTNKDKVLVDVQYNYYPELYAVNPESEQGQAYAEPDKVVITSGDLFLGNSYAIAHELSHELMFRHTKKADRVAKVFSEGFAEYNCYAAIKYLNENNPTVSYYIDENVCNIKNMYMSDDDILKTAEMELSYWLDHEVPTNSGNPGYDIGFRLMGYLDELYGDHGKWIENVDNTKNEIAATDMAYGEGATDGFYKWLIENNYEKFCFPEKYVYKLDDVSNINIYPCYDASGNSTKISENVFSYNDLYISVEDTRRYIEEYKEHSIDGLTLTVEKDVNVAFFDCDGHILDYVNSPKDYSLSGVSYVKLDGEGTCRKFKIDGYDRYGTD